MTTTDKLPLDKRIFVPNSDLRTFGSPGASLTWGIGGQKGGVVAAGLEGEKMTAKILDAFVQNPNTRNMRVFHSIQWPGSNGDTDHIVVMGNLVLLVDSKRWKSKRKYSVTPRGAILRGTVNFPEGKVKMVPALASWKKVLPKEAKVYGIVCVAQKEVFVPQDKNWYKAPFRLVTAEKLIPHIVETIKREQTKNPGIVEGYNKNILATIGSNMVKPRNRLEELLNREALEN